MLLKNNYHKPLIIKTLKNIIIFILFHKIAKHLSIFVKCVLAIFWLLVMIHLKQKY